MDAPSPTCELTPRKRKLRKQMYVLKRNLKRTTAMNYRLRKKNLKFSAANVLKNLLVNKTPAIKTLVYMQCFHKNRTYWTMQEKHLCLSLYYKSPSNYKHMLKNLKFILPGISTIQAWLKIYNLKTGFTSKLCDKLKMKVKSMSEMERECVIAFDEIKLKPGLDYNAYHDMIEGFQDFGDQLRSNFLANNALLFYARGLLFNWKQPLCYFLSCGPVKSDIVLSLLQKVVDKCFRIGLKTRIIICDQGSNNRSAISQMGVTIGNPSLTIGNNKCYICYDTPHLLKSLRNTMMNQKLEIQINGGKVSWQDIVDVFNVDKRSSTTRMLLKITTKHINPTSFEKMKVKYAAQIFSNCVSTAIFTAVATNDLKSETAINTALFLKEVNNIFDTLNSKVAFDSNPYKSALSVYRDIPYKTLVEAEQYFKKIKIYEQGVERKNIYCINGFVLTIQAILSLWGDLKNEGKKFLLTNRINQDPVENCFSVIRNRGGYNPQPTSKQFRIALQHNMYIKLMNPVESANCEVDEDQCLTLEENTYMVKVSTEENLYSTKETSLFTFSKDVSDEEQEVISVDYCTLNKPDADLTLEMCSNVYVAGYLCHKLLKKFQCEECKLNLLKENDSIVERQELHIFYKDYGISDDISHLVRPTSELCNVIDFCLKTFNNAYQKFKLNYKITEEIKKQLLYNVKIKFPLWFEQCKDHKEFLINHLIKIKLYRALKWELEKLPQKSNVALNKPHRKIRILNS